MKEVNLKIEHIFLFYNINRKIDNDYNNKIRENIIYKILNNNINNEWYNKENKWNELKINLFNTVIKDKIDYKIELKGCRKCNYDFLLKDKNDNIKKIEFKYNCNSITKYPQFLSISSNNFIKDEGYSSFFYDNYLEKILDLINIKIPEKDKYLKYIYNNNYNNLEIFNELKINENKIRNKKKKIVIESIDKYINEKVKINIEELNKYLKEKEKDKYYLLFKNGKFNYDFIKEEELEIKDIKEIKNKNTIILNTNSSSYISMLLRWKNHLGILYPAWQISLIRK